MKRFWDKVKKTTGCWEWQGSLNTAGYGQYMVKRTNWQAHRFSYQLTNGSIPDGMCICHHCDNHLCVNPDHLFMGTHADNVADKVSKGRQRAPRGVMNGRSVLTESMVRQMRKIYATGNYTTRSLASVYGVSFVTVHRALASKTWSHINAD